MIKCHLCQFLYYSYPTQFISYPTQFISKRKANINPPIGANYNPIPLGLYINIAIRQSMSPIHNSQIAFNLIKSNFNPFTEEFWSINLNSCLVAHNLKMISKGTLNFCPVHPRDLFREALMSNSYAIIIAHNHPSLNTNPTQKDITLTKKLVKISKLIEIPILDHIIFTDQKFYSFKENNLI